MTLLHASLVAFGPVGVLIRGPSGSGKSQLCLQLMDRNASLVADDQVKLSVENNRLMGKAPEALAGMLEIRGLGLVKYPHVPEAEIKLVVDLRPFAEISRMPEPHEMRVEILGFNIHRFSLDPQTPAAVEKLQAALTFFQLR